MGRIREILNINPRELEPDPHNARTDIGDLVGLAETIREHGVLQPLGVARRNGNYRVVYGNRRREAAIVVGLDSVPCLLLDGEDATETMLCQLLENLQRKPLNDMEQGRALKRLRDSFAEANPTGISERVLNDLVAKQLGLSPRTIQRYIALCELPAPVQDLLRREELTVTHAQHLLTLSTDARRTEVGTLAADEGLSAADLGRLCGGLVRNPNIAAADALAKVRQGDAVDAITAQSEVAVAERMGRAPKAQAENDDADLWPGEQVPDEDEEPRVGGTMDGNRRYRVRGLDSFMDELSRLVRCAEDGDLEKFVAADQDGKTKAVLALKQLAFLNRAVADLAK
ncbi:MAG: ParB/RepB/Spo0J family partition protein [Chloroflexota bacterium]